MVGWIESSESTLQPDPSKIAITVTEVGFEPAGVTVKKGVATTLVFTRKSDKTGIVTVHDG